MEFLYIKEIALVIIGASLGKFLDWIFISRKDKNEYAIKLIETLQKEIDRLNEKQNEMEKEYKQKYETLMGDYKGLQKRYENLRKELEKHTKNND